MKRIAVEKNGEIVPKAKYAETLLAEGDALEVVSFVGGG
jgi:sulfur carrier protein